MLYMKGDDMDEILRKAAENYEVDADAAADWDSVYAAVHEADEKTVVTKEKKKRRFIFWWLFLIPLGWIAHTEYNKFYTGNTKTNVGSSSPVKTKSSADKTNSQQSSTTTNYNSLNKNEVAKQHDVMNTTTFSHKQNSSVSKNKPETINNNSFTNNADNNSVVNNNVINNSLLPQKQQTLIQTQPADKKDIANIQQQKSIEPVTQPTVANNQQNSLPNETNAQATIQNQNKQAGDINNATKASSAKKEKLKANYFYTGLMAGGDLSSIKYQKTKPVGYSAGLLVGYKFNKLSIESGFFIDKKNYFTKGEYFDKSKIYFLKDAEVLTADGYCKMFEIPLNLKYDFSTHKNHTWFATGGFSSYLMNKEYYNYAYTKNNQMYHGGAPYYHTTKDWLSVLNISAGYQLQTGNKINIRIEPYYKIPLSGMGTANLHITSIGVNVGITRKIP